MDKHKNKKETLTPQRFHWRIECKIVKEKFFIKKRE